jgi:hypothetical protein
MKPWKKVKEELDMLSPEQARQNRRIILLRRAADLLEYCETQEEKEELAIYYLVGMIQSTIPERFAQLSNLSKAELIKNKLLDYPDFLKGYYWSVVRQQALINAKFICQQCGKSDEYLLVHHRTYANHGYEHLHMPDLMVLCNTCHAKRHNKKVA